MGIYSREATDEAECRANIPRYRSHLDPASSFEAFVQEQGYTMEELEKLSESVEFE